MTVPYSSFPKAYVACFLTECPLRETCLHKLYVDAMTDEEVVGTAVMPGALAEKNLVGGRCRYYREGKKVVCYGDFSHLFDEVRQADVASVKQAVYSYLGSRFEFYRYSRHESSYYTLTQQKADDIARIFARYGYQPPKYGETFETYIF